MAPKRKDRGEKEESPAKAELELPDSHGGIDEREFQMEMSRRIAAAQQDKEDPIPTNWGIRTTWYKPIITFDINYLSCFGATTEEEIRGIYPHIPKTTKLVAFMGKRGLTAWVQSDGFMVGRWWCAIQPMAAVFVDDGKNAWAHVLCVYSELGVTTVVDLHRVMDRTTSMSSSSTLPAVSTAKYLHEVTPGGKTVHRDIIALVRAEAGATQGVPKEVAQEASAAAIFAKYTSKQPVKSKSTPKARRVEEEEEEEEEETESESPGRKRKLRSATPKPPVPGFTDETAAAQQLLAMGAQASSSIASRIGSRVPPGGRGQALGGVSKQASEAARAAMASRGLHVETRMQGRASALQSPMSTASGKSIDQLEDENRKLQAQLRMQVSTTEMLQTALTRTGESGPAAIERRRVYAQQLEMIWEACRTAYTASIAINTDATQGIRTVANTVAIEYKRFRTECGRQLAGDFMWNENINVDASLD
jgi:hypothetical protein